MNERDDILIDGFLRGSLSSDDEKRLEERLLDSDFKQKFDEANLLLEVLKEEEAKKMKDRLSELEMSEFSGSTGKSDYKLINVIGSILGIIIIGIILYFALKPEKLNNKEIYATYYEPYPNIIDPIVKGNSDSLNIFQHYELQAYDLVIKELSAKPKLDIDEQFYLGSAYLAKGNTLDSGKIFRDLETSEKYEDASFWYQALICLKENGDYCKLVFEPIASDTDNSYHKKAAELLKNL